MTRGLRLLRLGGTGPNLLLIHGFGADRMTWLANQDVLLQSSSVFVCDLPAHGEQPPLAEAMTISRMVDELISQLQLWSEPFVLVGHSLGGAIAIEVAARRPNLVAALALIAPAGLGTGIDRDFVVGFSALADIDSALALLRRLVARPRLITPHIALRVIEHLDRSGVRSAMRVLGDQLIQVDTSIKPHVASVALSKIPRVVIWGEDDQINPIDRSKLATFNTQMIALPNTAHLPHIEASKVVNEHLSQFLKASLH
ncbi:alpha/beta fold hydrolase [Bradyrhizobium sp. BWA-3-5]|uniref:alpha/beta fold hydrolase n=1 Tax=Bradyrhizobium sp. BWA-3-5 TaxID=3080013 RepID=UPI00293E9987|nr:alpha/beta fold hydrolase [Bradyrhizobium sp. BWA-3-5]WOH63936.1 alpha/beta fold hydrolase [Bradyrhizobium sp. BWA-3-5]